MLFTTVLAMFVITQTTKLIFPTLIETNLIFYMIVFMLLMTFMNLTRHTFQQGYFNFADDTKVEMLFGIKAFIIAFVFLSTWGSTTFFDFDLEKAHEATMQRVNLTMQLMGGHLALPVQFTYFFVAILAGLVTFGTTKLNIRFSYYFYVLTKNSQQLL